MADPLRKRGRYAGLTDDEVSLWKRFMAGEPGHELSDYKDQCRLQRADQARKPKPRRRFPMTTSREC